VLTRRRARGVKQRVLPDDHGGALWHVPSLAGLRSSGELAQFAADVDHGGSARQRGRPRHRPPQRVVELERRGRVPPDPQPAQQALRERLRGEQLHQRPSADGRHHLTRGQLLASTQRHPGGTPASDDHPLDMRVAPHHDPLTGRDRQQRIGDPLLAPRGKRPTMRMGEQRQQEPERTAPRGRRREPRVLRGPRQPRRRPARPVEDIKTKRLDRSHHPPRKQKGIPAQRERQRDRRADRRQGAENGIHETLSQQPELLDQPPPSSSRARKRSLQRRDRRPELMVQRDRGSVLERVRHDRPGPDPPKPLGLELELADRRRSNCHRVKAGLLVIWG
jgi:hypothetical protein